MSNIGFLAEPKTAGFRSKWHRFVWPYQSGPKRALDVALALLLLPMLTPIIAALYLVVRAGGPGFYGHRRVGQNGRMFTCWKLRTMVCGAETHLSEILAQNPALKEEWAHGCKLSNDPRITPMGEVLRKTGLDELPQIWNVLRGDMSLIGPRPVTKDELVRYGNARPIYEALRPGITGLWQVSGRNSLSYSARVALDQHYAAHLSFWTDLRLLWRTLPVLLARTGR